MKNFFKSLIQGNFKTSLIWSALFLFSIQLSSQCTLESGAIKGKVFLDYDNDGLEDLEDQGLTSILVSIYDQDNELAGYATTKGDGNYIVSGLSDDNFYRVEFEYQGKYSPSFLGNSNNSSVQFVTAPVCDANFGLVEPTSNCGTNPELITSCFVQGETEGSDLATIVGFEYQFNASSSVKKYASHKETGCIWGVAWKSTTSEVFSSAFVKQYAGLTEHGHGAIFRTKIGTNGSTTNLFVDLATKVNVGDLAVTDITNCTYGAQVGKVGLGAIVISPDEEYLYVINIGNKSLVRISTTNKDDVEEYAIPDPGCKNGEYEPFALNFYNDKLYIGVTCTAITAKAESASKAIVYEWDPASPESFSNIFETNYIKGFWKDTPTSSIETSHWLTDIGFTNEGNMIIGLSDRIGHRYCKVSNPRLDSQKPDILLVYKDSNGNWKLENNGKTDVLTGSGVGNGQGPGGGEFFGEDAWPASPLYHPEVALGSFFVLPNAESGKGTVVASAYDPLMNSYSGGFHRYSTVDGTKLSGIELYTRNPNTLFGKATGFGEVVPRCSAAKIQIGNYVWNDINKNGLQDANENPIGGLTINLLDENCGIINSVVTGVDGSYSFSDLEKAKQYYLAIPSDVLNQDFGILSFSGNEYVFTTTGNSSDFIDNNASLLDIDCGKVILPVKTELTDHNYDIGLVQPGGFDLALKKEILTSGIVKLNEVVPFRITVYNQGGVPAKNIKINDYIAGGYEFLPSENPDWNLVGDVATTTLTETVLPGANASAIIRLKVVSVDLNELVNVAEISSATDHDGKHVDDVDSEMDDDKDNDMGGDVGTPSDDWITDDGTFDEDDSDPAVPQIFDLALKQYYEDDNCVTGGSEITVKTCVYNQGNVASKSYAIVNYGAPNLIFDETKNPAWKEENGVYVFEGGILAPGTKVTIDLKFDVINISQNTEIVNYAEISSSIPEGRNMSEDSDSTPDSDVENDKGGKPNTSDDNYIFGLPDAEEDDHDPIVINSRTVDLALILTTQSRLVREGEEACFKIEVFNQGFMPVSEIQLINYLPKSLAMNAGQGWEKVGINNFIKNIKFNGVFAPGDVYMEEYCTTVGDLTNVYTIENLAEISSITGVCGEDLSDKDKDSRADDIRDNDAGGQLITNTDNTVNELPSIDEDDHDPAYLINVESSISTPCTVFACPTEPGNGLYSSKITLKAPSGMVWTVDQAIDYYTNASVIGSLVDFSNDVLTESPINPTESEYTITGVFKSGVDYEIRLKSDNNDYQYLSGKACKYERREVTGPRALCDNGVGTYYVKNTDGDTFLPTATDGNIDAIRNNGAEIDVTWNPGAGTREVRFVKTTGACEDPAVLDVVTGSSDLAMKCKTHINLSLDKDCSVEVKPNNIIAGVPDPNAAYAIMLTDHHGDLMPENIVDSKHIGKTIEVKLIEGCGGNSCWGTILVEDKTKPEIICEDVTVSCYKINQYRGPVAIDNCGDPVTMHTLDSAYTQVMCNATISGVFIKDFQAEDASGNKSDICRQTINIARINLDTDVVFPKNFKMADALDCSGYEDDNNGFPSPHLTGIPTIEGDEIYPGFDDFCNLTATYKDEGPYPFECAQKIIRKWTVWDLSCIADPVQKYVEQTIIIGDKANPTFKCPASFSASASYHDCLAKVTLPSATDLKDDCSTTFRVDMTYPGGFQENQNGGKEVFLPVGKNLITYRVYDECDRSNSCSYTIDVKDETSPLAVCDQNTTVSLLSDGTSYLYAQTLDDGSVDACGIVGFEARRMDAGANCGVNTPAFGPIVDFCCDDVSTVDPVIVELRVTDINNNSNTCMVNVFVQDKTLPKITCPADVTIDCQVHYDLEDLSVYGTAVIDDACGADLDEEPTEFVDKCRVGYIERVFSANDGSNVATCTQRIYIENDNPFNLGSIKKPEDYYVVNTCSADDLDPDNLPVANARPILNEGICDLVASTYKDKVYNFTDADGTCFKIIRKWTVINYCVLIDNKPEEIVFDQVIKVSNTEPPSIISDLSDVTAFLYDTSCILGPVTLQATGDDKCTPNEELNWSYEIHINGSVTPTFTDKGKGPLADASGAYVLGDHYILWSFEDMCGNLVTRRQNFSVEDNKKPTAGCLQSVSISLVAMDTDDVPGPDIEMACIGPDSLNASSSHPCLPLSDLTFSFDSLGTLNELCFDCYDLGENIIDFYVIDIYGNYDICKVTVDVQDNNSNDICPDLDDCIEWPADVTVTECNGDVTPVVLNSVTTVDPDCICDDFDEPTYTDSLVTYPNATCTLLERTWSVTFNCGNNPVTFTYKQKVSVLNEIAPDIECPKDVTVDANATCMAVVSLPVPTITNDNCNSDVIVTHNSVNADNPGNDASGTYPEGVTNIVFTVTDGCENTNTCTTVVTVNDNTPPVAMCTDITINLNGNGSYTLTQANKDAISDGSFDNCSLTLTVTPDMFNCEDVDTNVEVTVTASDGTLTDMCTANVFVEDNVPPVAVCTDITVELDPAGQLTLSQAQINIIGQNSTDNCDDFSLSVDNDEFDCTMLGNNSVVLTVSDDTGNTDTCEATVTVEDNESPVAICTDITVNLNSNGIRNLTAGQVTDLGELSTDNCTFNISANPNTFDCTNVGDNAVLVTITDTSNNTDTCTANVTVMDITPPSLPNGGCADITIMLDAMLMGMLDANDLAIITAGASDACGFVPSANAMFDCDDIGVPVNVTVTLTDPSNNTNTCDITVTVVESGTPTLICSDITVYLDINGEYALSTMDSMDLVDQSTGNCGTHIEIEQTTFDCDDISSVDVLIELFDATNTLVDDCTSTISVIDTIPPTAVCNDIVVELDASGLYTVNATDVENISLGSADACGIDTAYVDPASFTCGDIGDNTVTLTVEDNNGNSDTCSATITVEDNLTIAAVCNDLTVIVMSDAPYVLTPADSSIIVDGTTDNCEFTVSFDPNSFTCADTLNSPIAVTVSFFDSQGLIDTTCTSLITVESHDTLICIANDLTVYIDSLGSFDITVDDIDGGSGAGCDAAIARDIDIDFFICNDVINSPIEVTLTVMSATDTAVCTSQVTVIDSIGPDIYCQPLIEINCDLFDGNIDGIAVVDSVWDNCTDYTLDTIILIDQFNTCGQGILSRNFIVNDLLSGSSDTCNSVISIIETSTPLTQADFNLPVDITVDNCTGIDTMFTGSVTLIPTNLTCSFVEISFTDDPAMLPGMCIDTIQRTWTMVDTCNTSSPIAPYVQTIVVIDTIAPDLVISMDTVFVANPNNDCEFFVDLSGVVTNLDCDTTGVVYSNNSPYADNPNSIDASGIYPENTITDITIIATDGCGNSDTISYVVAVDTADYIFDCVKLIIPIDTVTFNVCVAATDVASFTGACDSNYTILLYDEVEDVLSDTLKFDCDDIGDNVVYVYLYQGSTLVDSCTVRSDLGRTLVTVTDNGMDCPTSISRVSGKVKTYYNQAIQDVSIELEGSEMPNEETSADGTYVFPEMASGGNYMLKPFKDDGLLEGVSTLDLILMQRHILKIESLHNTYDVVAADINNDNKLSASDLVELRKNLLGVENSFKNNTSWKMIDAKYEFPVYMDPFAETYPLFYELAPMNGNILADFIAVKIGDVNGSYTSFRSGSNIENRSMTNLIGQDEIISAGNEVEITLALSEIEKLMGMQFEMNIKGLTGITTVEIEGVDFDYYVNGETLRLSLSDVKPIMTQNLLLKLKFMTNESGKLSEIIGLDNESFNNELYDENLNIRNIGLSWNSVSSDIYNFTQNTPNPWKDKTFVSFNVPQQSRVELKVTDITGKIIYTKVIEAEKGENTLEIRDADVNMESGVFLISLDIDGVRLQQKMIRLN